MPVQYVKHVVVTTKAFKMTLQVGNIHSTLDEQSIVGKLINHHRLSYFGYHCLHTRKLVTSIDLILIVRGGGLL